MFSLRALETVKFLFTDEEEDNFDLRVPQNTEREYSLDYVDDEIPRIVENIKRTNLLNTLITRPKLQTSNSMRTSASKNHAKTPTLRKINENNSQKNDTNR